MELLQRSRNLFKQNESFKMLEFLLELLLLLTGFFAISIVPFLRRDFGERYLSWINLFFGYSVVANFTFLGNMIAMMTRHGGSEFMPMFWMAFILTSFYHRWVISRKNKAGVKWHTRYLGTSLLPLPFSQEKIYKFFEPVIVFGIGQLLWTFSGQVGLWLMISAVALFIHNHILYYNERRTMLDMVDADIEATYFSAALSGKSPNETAGFVVAESSIRLMNQDAGLKSAFGNLSPDISKVLDSDPHLESERS